MKTIVITGATSGIGVALVKMCLEAGHRVIALARMHSGHIGRLPESDNLRLVDCRLEDVPRDLPLHEKCHVFYHLAWSGTDRKARSDPELQQANIGYTLNLLRLAGRLGCEKFIGAGSQAEYGPHQRVLLSPEDSVCPDTAYGAGKYAAGRLGALLARQLGMDFLWVRVFSVYGRYDRAETMLRSAISRMKRGEECFFTAGTQVWDYLHCEDAARAFFLLGEKAAGNKVYCLGCGQERKLKDYILEMREAVNPGAVLRFGAIPFRPGEERGICADISALRQDTGWKPEIPFRQGLQSLLE